LFYNCWGGTFIIGVTSFSYEFIIDATFIPQITTCLCNNRIKDYKNFVLLNLVLVNLICI